MNTALNSPNAAKDPIAHAAKAPNVAQLLAEYRRCAPMADSGWNPLTHNDDVRFNRWAGKAPDGKRHDTKDKEAFPFDGCSDSEVFLSDDIINSIVAESFEAFWRAWLLPKFGMTEDSTYAIKLADHLVNTALYDQLYTAVELSEQYRQQYGWCALQPTWVREVALENKTFTFQQLEAFAAQNPEFAMLPEMILDPTQEDLAIQAFHALYAIYTKGLVAKVSTFRAVELDDATLRRAVRDLRGEANRTELPLPYICRDEPTIITRKPHDEVFISGDTADLQQRRFYLRCWEDEVSLRSKQNTVGWNKAFVDEALKHKGKYTVWGASATLSATSTTASNPPTNLAAAMTQTVTPGVVSAEENKDGLVEILYAVYRSLDANNVPGVYMTVLCPHIGAGAAPDLKEEAKYGWHGLLAGSRGKIPLIIGTRERVAANIGASRGVPQVACSWQRQKKVQHDGLADFTAMMWPPINEYTSNYGSKFKFGPMTRNRYTNPGKEAHFMDIPWKGFPLSFEFMKNIEHEANAYFGLATPEFPNGNPAKKQKNIGSFLLMWSAAITELLQLCLANMSDEEFSVITGAPEGWLESKRNAPKLGAKLQFDVRELNPEFVLKQLDVINKTIVPGDVGGAINRNGLTRWQMRVVSPLAARHLIQEEDEASKKIFDDTRAEFAQMFLGNEAQMTENDPTARRKLEYGDQIVAANETYKEAMQNPLHPFSQRVQEWLKNIMQSIKQEQNKQTGRYGVKTQGPQMR